MLELASDLPEVVYPDGAALFVEGRRHDEIVILVEGQVRISKAGVDIGLVSEPGAVLGEVGVLLDVPATATATAVGRCVCRRAGDPRALLLDNPAFTLEIASTLARRLDLVTGFLADLQNQYADRDDSLGVVAEVLGALSQYRGRPIEPGSERVPDPPC